jgi:hypothetical protein
MEQTRSNTLSVHDLVRLRFDVGVDARSRVEGVEGDVVWVAAPSEGATLLHRYGKETLALQWMAPRGRYTQPVQFLGTEGGHIETWRLQKVGEPTIEQLREFVRVEATLPIVASVPQSGEESVESVVVSGTTIDISEGGVRCMLATQGLAPELLQPETEVLVHLDLEGREVELAGKVLRRVQALHGRSEVVFMFHPSHHADELRRFVFATQVRARAASRA